MNDPLAAILALVRAELPSLDERSAARIELRIRQAYAGERIYIAAAPRRVALLQLGTFTATQAIPSEIKRAFGVSTRHAYRLLAEARKC